jgi:hypothetical protein
MVEKDGGKDMGRGMGMSVGIRMSMGSALAQSLIHSPLPGPCPNYWYAWDINAGQNCALMACRRVILIKSSVKCSPSPSTSRSVHFKVHGSHDVSDVTEVLTGPSAIDWLASLSMDEGTAEK